MKRILMPMFIGMMLSLVASARAQDSTFVAGTIVGETWTKENSPYCVIGDITVAALTIRPGVEIIFRGNYSLEIHGVISAVGSAQDSIHFFKTQSIAGWKGIRFFDVQPGSELAYCIIENSTEQGIRIENSYPVIRNCTVRNNSYSGGSSKSGAGVWSDVSIELTDCVIAKNAISVSNNECDGHGGGVFVAGDLVLKNCSVHSNSISASNSETVGRGHANAQGGGIYVTGSSSIVNSRIYDNSLAATVGWSAATCYGGGIYAMGELDITNSIIDNNRLRAYSGDPPAFGYDCSLGGGIHLNDKAVLINTIVSNNAISPRWSYEGAGIYCTGPDTVSITNCTIYKNIYQGIRVHAGTTVHVLNSIIWENVSGQVSGTASVDYSCVQDGYAGTGNIAYHPVLGNFTPCIPAYDSYIILPGSPCIDAGHPASDYLDACFPFSLGTSRNDMGAHGGPLGCGWLCEPTSQALLRFNPNQVKLLDTYQSTIDLVIDRAQNVMGIRATIHYESDEIEIACYKRGDFLETNGGIITDLSSIDTLAGVLDINLATAGGEPRGVSGSGTVMSITLAAKGRNPTSALVIESASLRDSENTPIAVLTENGSITALDCDLLGDFDYDADVDFADYTFFVSCWNEIPDNPAGDIAGPIDEGPCQLPPPWCIGDYCYPADGVIDFEDQMCFSIMYNWTKNQPICAPSLRASRSSLAVSSNGSVQIEVPKKVDLGQQFTVPMVVGDASTIIGLHAELIYDSDALVYLGADFERDSKDSGNFISSLDRSGEGWIEINRTVLGNGSFTETGPMTIELYFEAKEIDKASIEVMEVDLRTGGNHSVNIRKEDYEGTMEIFVSGEAGVSPSTFALRQNYPNPFNPTTTISFSLAVASEYSLTIFNVSGQRIKTFSGKAKAGTVGVVWRAENCVSGLYLYRLEAGSFVDTKKMILLR